MTPRTAPVPPVPALAHAAPAGALRWLRRSLIVAPLAVALLSAAGYQRWRANQQRLAAVLETAGVAARSEEALSQLAWERGTDDATLAAARVLVYDFLAVQGDAEQAAARGAQLALARTLAREALAEQPSSWQGWLFEGATIFLERAQQRDRRLYTEAAAWEAPLLRARALAPGKSEPRRFLVAAYLEVWPALAAAKKQLARPLVAEVFASEPRTFTRLLPAWLAVARGGEVFEPIPDRSDTWRQLADQLARRRDWRGLISAHERQYAALERELEQQVAEGERSLAAPDRRAGRTALLRAIAQAPTEARFARHVAQALAVYPPGLHEFSDVAALRRWLEWAAALRAVGASPLEPVMVDRLAAAIGEPAPSVPPFAGRAQRVWRAAEWRQHGHGWRLELQPAVPARRLAVALAAVPASGAVVAWQWDGAEVAVTAVRPGREIELDVVPEPDRDTGPHLLELVPLAGGAVVPGAVRLLGDGGGSPAQPVRRYGR